jgi:hypothetical protein
MRLDVAGHHANTGSHIMKTTIEISDDLFLRAQRLARKEKTTFRALTEAGLRLVVSGKHSSRSKRLPPLVTSGSDGLTDEFKDWNCNQIRDEVYRGRGSVRELWTADRDFSLFPQLKTRNPLVQT